MRGPSAVLPDAFASCYGSGLIHPPAYVSIKRGPSGVLFYKCPLCKCTLFAPPDGGWDKVKWMTRAEIFAVNKNALIIP